jgi:4-hydroxybenzoate polyprenyltransferase
MISSWSDIVAVLGSEATADFLRVLTIVLSFVFCLMASVMLGRDLSDLEYQRAAGINGIRRIQGHINKRTHANRVILGVSFMTAGMLSLSDVNAVLVLWMTRLIFIAMLISYTWACVQDWFDEKRQMEYLVEEEARAKQLALSRGDGFPERSSAVRGRVQPTEPRPFDAGDGSPVAP